MNTFRTLRPLLVDAEQCTEVKTVVIDAGSRRISQGDWVIRGENGECYVVDDAFFHRTFAPIQTYPWLKEEGRDYGC